MTGIRQSLKKKTDQKTSEFRLRGMEHTRIEGLSDGVFAIAIALLLISSDVPERFEELKLFLKDFVPFGATIILLMVIWYQHFIFFIRYGLRDAWTVTLNTLVLFLILFYVYPLKFLFKTLFTLFSGMARNDQSSLQKLFSDTIPAEEGPNLMIIYGLGAAMIFIALALLYGYALHKRSSLALTASEIYDTRTSLGTNLTLASIPLLSAVFASFEIGDNHSFIISGFTYFLYPIVMPAYGIWRERVRNKLFTVQN